MSENFFVESLPMLDDYSVPLFDVDVGSFDAFGEEEEAEIVFDPMGTRQRFSVDQTREELTLTSLQRARKFTLSDDDLFHVNRDGDGGEEAVAECSEDWDIESNGGKNAAEVHEIDSPYDTLFVGDSPFNACCFPDDLETSNDLPTFTEELLPANGGDVASLSSFMEIAPFEALGEECPNEDDEPIQVFLDRMGHWREWMGELDRVLDPSFSFEGESISVIENDTEYECMRSSVEEIGNLYCRVLGILSAFDSRINELRIMLNDAQVRESEEREECIMQKIVALHACLVDFNDVGILRAVYYRLHSPLQRCKHLILEYILASCD
jgi:hypothetical protein